MGPRAWGGPQASGVARAHPEDFRVTEELGFTPSGDGEHALIQVEKRERNTDWVARWLARRSGVRPVAVGYAGRKDYRAVARQWFSVHLAGRPTPAPQALETAGVRVAHCVRHDRKLRRGALRANHFEIRLRRVSGDRQGIEERLHRIRAAGAPNYYGWQRFGRGGGNLDKARALFQGRRQVGRDERSLYLSAVRAWLFNQVLAARVSECSWDQALPGDVLMLAGSRSWFPIRQPATDIEARVRAMDLHPTGPLCGRGTPPVADLAARVEERVLAPLAPEWLQPLTRFGLAHERRSLRLTAAGLDWDWAGADTLVLRLSLAPGCYATAVLHELVDVSGEAPA